MADKIVETYMSKLIHESVDQAIVQELVLYITNDSQIYRQRISPIIKNLARKVGKGTYDGNLAIKAFMYAAVDGIKKYEKEHAEPGWGGSVNKETKTAIAQELADFYGEQIGEAIRSKNGSAVVEEEEGIKGFKEFGSGERETAMSIAFRKAEANKKQEDLINN